MQIGLYLQLTIAVWRTVSEDSRWSNALIQSRLRYLPPPLVVRARASNLRSPSLVRCSPAAMLFTIEANTLNSLCLDERSGDCSKNGITFSSKSLCLRTV